MLEVRKKENVLTYLLLTLMGLAILLICSLFQKAEVPFQGEYAYSSFLRYHLTLPAWVLFCITGVVIGYFSNFNFGIKELNFLSISTYINHGSNSLSRYNLIPFEFGMYFSLCLSGIAAVYLGRLIFTQTSKSKKIKTSKFM